MKGRLDALYLFLLGDDTLTGYPHCLGLLDRDRNLDFTVLAHNFRDHDLAFIFLFLVDLDSFFHLTNIHFRIELEKDGSPKSKHLNRNPLGLVHFLVNRNYPCVLDSLGDLDGLRDLNNLGFIGNLRPLLLHLAGFVLLEE